MKFFTSDLHLGHVAVLRMCNRPFANVDQMNKTIIDNINAVVSPHNNDELYIIGDISHHISAEEAMHWLNQIKCRNIYLIKGNHDKTYPEGYFKGIYNLAEVTDQGYNFVLCHYPMMSWRHSRRKSFIHLHGHIHSDPSYNQENWNKGIQRFDVGVDANNFVPISSKQIIEFFKDCPFDQEANSHHSKN